jgi:hypothetical protein
MNSTKSFVSGALITALVFGGALILKNGTCLSSQKQETAVSNSRSQISALPDTPENRLQAARLAIEAYPNQKFGAAIALRVEKELGKDVTEQARRSFRAKTDDMENTSRRAEYLADLFTPAELAALASLLATPEGQTVFEKLYLHDERWRQHLSPMLLDILSGKT